MSHINRKFKFLFTVAFIAGLIQSGQSKMMEDTVALVNGTPMFLSEYRRQLNDAVASWSKADPVAMGDPAFIKKLREQTLEQMIDQEILYQQGVTLEIKVRDHDIDNGESEIKARFMPTDLGTDSAEDAQVNAQRAFEKQLKTDGLTYDQFRENLKKQIMVRKLIDQEVRPKIKTPADKEVQAYFGKIKAYITSGSTLPPTGMNDDDAMAVMQAAAQIKEQSSERVKLSRILIKISPGASENEINRAKKTADGIYSELMQGTSSFAEIATVESEDPDSAARGGDIGWLARGIAPPNFEQTAFSLAVGAVSKPILTDLGYHIIRLEAKQAAQPIEFEKFKDDLKKFMMNVSFQKELTDYIKSLKDKAVIERHLPTT